jgi:integrase
MGGKKKDSSMDRVIDSVQHLSLKVDIKAREGTSLLQLETRVQVGGKSRRVRRSARTTDLAEARENAVGFANALLTGLAGGADALAAAKRARGEDLTLGDVFRVYRELRIPYLGPDRAQLMERVMRTFEATLRADSIVLHLSQIDVDRHVAKRKKGGIEYIQVRQDGSQRSSTLGPTGSAGLFADWQRLSTIFAWAAMVKMDGRPLLEENPLKGLRLPPKVRNPKRPAMNAERYQVMIAVAGETEQSLRDSGLGRRGVRIQVGEPVRTKGGHPLRPRAAPGTRMGDHMPPGFLKLLLVLARETGHRKRSIAGLRIRDILLTRTAMRGALARIGQNELLADDWPYGAIYWSRDLDKKKYDRVIPISKRVREALVKYLEKRGTLELDAPLIPSSTDPSCCAGDGLINHAFRRAEEIACNQGYDLPHVSQGAWHMFRRMWRSERAGYFHDKLVAFCGGWSVEGSRNDAGDHDVMNSCYLDFEGWAIYLCVEFDRIRDAPADGRVAGVNVVVQAPTARGRSQLQSQSAGGTGEPAS